LANKRSVSKQLGLRAPVPAFIRVQFFPATPRPTEGERMRLRSAPLEGWLRDRYFSAEIDISSSGVQPYSMAELRAMTGLGHEDIDALVFNDGYSLGFPAVRAAIARRWGDGQPEKVMTTNGSSEAISLVLMTLLRPSDEVIIVQPGYHLLVEFAAALGCRTKTWWLNVDDGWKASLDDLAELVTAKTRAIIVNFPQNPTGASIGTADLDLLLRRAEQVGAYVLWDAAFAELTYDSSPLPDISARYPRGISFGTFSKAFGLPGLRFGWCIAPPGILAGCVQIRDYTTLHVSPLIELIALRVLENADRFLEPRLKQARVNRDALKEWAAGVTRHVSLILPAGGVAAFPRLDNIANTDEFCEGLFRQYGVLVIPGSCFGSPRHIRLGFGGATEDLVLGLGRLSSALSGASRSQM
jgi:capreomycidine synthase